MAYAPPTYNSVGFDFAEQGGYTAPAANSVSFDLAPISWSAAPVFTVLVAGSPSEVVQQQFPSALISSPGGVVHVDGAAAVALQENFPTASISGPLGSVLVSGGIPALYNIWTGVSPVGRILVSGATVEIDNRAPTLIDVILGRVLVSGLGVEPTKRLVFLPFTMFPGMSSDADSITIPIASLPGLTAAEADAVTGDWREVLQAILLRVKAYLDEPLAIIAPTTVRLFVLEDFNADHRELGRGLKRHISTKINITYTHCPSSLADEPPPE